MVWTDCLTLLTIYVFPLSPTYVTSMLSIYVYTNSPWESITIRRSVSLHFNWWISHRLKQEEVKSQHVCTDFLQTLYLKILWIQNFFPCRVHAQYYFTSLKICFHKWIEQKSTQDQVYILYTPLLYSIPMQQNAGCLVGTPWWKEAW